MLYETRKENKSMAPKETIISLQACTKKKKKIIHHK